jgi:hypothetical protein
MSYLAHQTTYTDYGVVQVGPNILVANGIIFLDQDVGHNANVIFSSVNVGGNSVVTTVIPTAEAGIALDNVVSSGVTQSFGIRNTGVISVLPGPGVSVSSANGNVTISSSGSQFINVYSTTTNYTASINDEYIGVNSAAAVTITLPSGVSGRVYTVKDEYGQGSGKITIQPQPSERIDRANNYIVSVPFQSVTVVFSGTQWHVI